MASPKELTLEEVREALIMNGGLVSQTAQTLGCDPSNVSHWITRHPELKECRGLAFERLKDMAEGKLMAAIKKGEMKWVSYFLDHHARDRGYGQRVHHTGRVQFDMTTATQGLTDEQLAAAIALRRAFGEDSDAGPGPGAVLGTDDGTGSETAGS